MATLRAPARPRFDVRAYLVGYLREIADQFTAEHPSCPFARRADLLETADEFEFAQWMIPSEWWLTSNPNQSVLCGRDGVLSIPERLDPITPMATYARPTR